MDRRAETTTPIGECEQCGRDVLAPHETLVWADAHTFHQKCYREYLAQRILGDVAEVHA